VSAEPCIELRGVRFARPGGAFLLQADELCVARGERVACFGPSGTGKTTLVELLAGILVPDAGTIAVGGTPVSSLPDDARRAWRRERVGLVFQGLELLEYLCALDNVLLPYHLGAGPAGAEARARAQGLLERAGVGHAAARLPARLSQGERQRVAVCRALATEPELLLCDEVTANLDPATAAATLDLLLAEAKSTGATVLFVTHDRALLGRFDRAFDVRALAGGLA